MKWSQKFVAYFLSLLPVHAWSTHTFQSVCIESTELNPVAGKPMLEFLLEENSIRDAFGVGSEQNLLVTHGLLGSRQSDLAFQLIYWEQTKTPWLSGFRVRKFNNVPFSKDRKSWGKQKAFVKHLLEDSNALEEFVSKWIKATIELHHKESRPALRIAVRSSDFQDNKQLISEFRKSIEKLYLVLSDLKIESSELADFSTELPFKSLGEVSDHYGRHFDSEVGIATFLELVIVGLLTSAVSDLPQNFPTYITVLTPIILEALFTAGLIEGESSYPRVRIICTLMHWLTKVTKYLSAGKSPPSFLSGMNLSEITLATNQPTGFFSKTALQSRKDQDDLINGAFFNVGLLSGSEKSTKLLDAVLEGFGISNTGSASFLPVDSIYIEYVKFVENATPLSLLPVSYFGVYETLLTAELHSLLHANFGALVPEASIENRLNLYEEIRNWKPNLALAVLDPNLLGIYNNYVHRLHRSEAIVIPEWEAIRQILEKLSKFKKTRSKLIQRAHVHETELQATYKRTTSAIQKAHLEKLLTQNQFLLKVLQAKHIENLLGSFPSLIATVSELRRTWGKTQSGPKSRDLKAVLSKLSSSGEFTEGVVSQLIMSTHELEALHLRGL